MSNEYGERPHEGASDSYDRPQGQQNGSQAYGSQPYDGQYGTQQGGQQYGGQQPQQYGAQQYGAQQYGQPAYGQQQYGTPGAMYAGGGMSDKSKVVAGILQLLLGGFAAGRWYLGWTKIALIQMLSYWAGLVIMMIGAIGGAMSGTPDRPGAAMALMPVGWLIMMGVGIWLVVDAIRMFLGKVPDAQGRPLQ